MLANLRIPSALVTAAICAGLVSTGQASSISVPLIQHRVPVDPVQHAAHATTKYRRRALNSHATSVSETLDGGFWFGSFDVGDGKNLSLLIDTGSSDVGINPDQYKPSCESKNLNHPLSYHYKTVFSNDCGVSNISADSYTDTVSFHGLTATNQGLYHINYHKQTNPGIITALPHDGIVGFQGNASSDSLVGKFPFFHTLCVEKQVHDCRFGLAFETNGKGTQILGGVDTTAFSGELTRVPLQTEWYGYGSVYVKGKPLLSKVNIQFDSGTSGIVAPASEVREYFAKVGIEAHTVNIEGCTNAVFGYYKCDAPPNLQFQLGPAGKLFTLEPSAFELANNGNNNCTAWITGLEDSTFPTNLWILGQAFMQGKYMDFDTYTTSVGIAPLKKK